MRRQFSWALIVLIPTVVLHLALTRGGFGLSPDSVFYLAAARTIVHEGQIATPIAYDDVAVPIGTVPRTPPATSVGSSGTTLFPMTRWPPGYPLSIAATMGLTGTSAVTSARIGIVATSIATLLLFAALAARAVGTWRGLLCAALLGSLPFYQMSTQWAWSESLFMVLTLGALYLLARWTDTPRRALPLTGAVVLCALALWTRYLGITLVPVVLGVVAWRTRRSSDATTPAGVRLVSALLPYPLLVAPLLLRNHHLSGTLTGGVPIGTWSGSIVRPIRPVLSLVESFLPAQHAQPGPWDVLVTLSLSATVWAAAVALLIVLTRKRRDDPTPHPEPPAPGISATALAFVYAGTYMMAVVVLAGMTVISAGPRMVYPAAVCLALPISLLFARRVPERRALALSAAAVAVIAVATFASVRFTEHLASGWPGYNVAAILERPVLRWARSQRASLPRRVFAEPWLIGAAQVDGLLAPRRLPDLEELPSDLSRHGGEDLLFLVSAGMPATWPCPAYLDRYRTALGAAADSVVSGDGWSAWWVRGGTEAAERIRAVVGDGTSRPCG